MKRFISLSALALLGGAPFSTQAADALQLAATSAPGAAECERVNSLTFVQRRVVAKAAEGVRPLVQYIHRTRAIHQLDVVETVAWLDERRELQRACGGRTTQLGQLAPGDE
jgi:hypothetical protein